VDRLNQPTLEQQAGSSRVPGKTNGNMKAVGNTDMRNRRSVWTVATKPYKGAHFATFPQELIEPMVLAGSRVGDIVLDPFMGSGTTAQVAHQLGRRYLGSEINQNYSELQDERLSQFCFEI
jgi:DNA modification methylase